MLKRNQIPAADTRVVAWILRALGMVDLLALVAVVMPASWMAATHAWAGLGELPGEPVVGYLARSTSALYALHGLLIVYISFDVARYWTLIRFFASVAVVHGLVMFGIDLSQGMPAWWTCVEGPSFAATGALVLVAQTMSNRGDGTRSVPLP
jgi:hypothetical protein